MDRIQSGIKGFDDLFEEGLPRGSNILIYGKPGVGKTIFALDFIYKGAKLYHENGVYVSLDQDNEDILDQTTNLDWNIKKYIKEGKISILHYKIHEIDRDLLNKIIKEMKRINAKRLVIDNLALLSLCPAFFKDDKFSVLYNEKMLVAYDIKQFIYYIIKSLKELGTTNIYLTFSAENNDLTLDTISEYVCDGVIHLKTRSLGKTFLRTLEINKMRKVHIKGGIYSFSIKRSGIEVEL